LNLAVTVGPRDTVSSEAPGDRLRCSWEVTAGLLPRDPMPEYTRRWLLTSETFYAEQAEQQYKTFQRYQAEAREYARSLEIPSALNWVNVEWVYL
jgi:hypothetical protein